MSRCFPFPPHVYTRNGETGNALIESIKLQTGREKAHSERKKEKKEQGRERKHHKSEEKCNHVEGNRVKEAKCNGLHRKNLAESIVDCLEKVKDETEQLERSGITEELEHPVSSQDPVYLSDSSQYSKKRKRDFSLSIAKCSENGGTIIRIRLRKHEKPEAHCNEQIDRTIQEAPSVSGNDNRFAESSQCSQPSNAQTYNVELAINKISSTELPAQGGSSESKRKKRKMFEGECESLFENWVPPALEFDAYELDDDWLSGSEKQNHDHGADLRSCGDDSDVLECRDSGFYPRVQFLPEGGVYALPYTIPF